MESTRDRKRKSKSKSKSGRKDVRRQAGLNLPEKMLKSQLRVPGLGLASALLGSGSGHGRSSRLFSVFFAFMAMVLVRITPRQMGMRMNAEMDVVMPVKMELLGAEKPEPKILGGTLAPQGRYRFVVNLVAVSANYRYRFW